MAATIDRASSATLVAESLGRTQALTPEGYLLCSDVRVARVGEMLYAAPELPGLDADERGVIRVTRDEPVLFEPDAVLSASGKDVTLHHPESKATDGMVAPQNWRDASVGVVLNPRRGEGFDAGYLVADLLIKRPDAIDAVRNRRLREVSLGYDCEYVSTGPGTARQVRIRINHAALVPEGRCGPTCAIEDHAMAAKPKKGLWGASMDAIKAAFYSKDEAAFQKALKDAEAEAGAAEPDGDEDKRDAGGVAVHVHNYGGKEDDKASKDEETDPFATIRDEFGKGLGAIGDEMRAGFKAFDERCAAIESRFKDADGEGEEGDKKDGEGDDDKDKSTQDSAGLAAEWRATVSKAEIIHPGARPTATFDAKAKATATADALCGFRRKVLDLAATGGKHKTAIQAALGGRTLDSLSCAEVGIAFDSAAQIATALNNAAVGARVVDAKAASEAAGGTVVKAPRTPAEQQALNVARRQKAGA